jgi:hypothetical protein
VPTGVCVILYYLKTINILRIKNIYFVIPSVLILLESDCSVVKGLLVLPIKSGIAPFLKVRNYLIMIIKI